MARQLDNIKLVQVELTHCSSDCTDAWSRYGVHAETINERLGTGANQLVFQEVIRHDREIHRMFGS